MLALSTLVHLRSNTGLPLYDICFMTDEGEVVIWDHETAEVKSFGVTPFKKNIVQMVQIVKIINV